MMATFALDGRCLRLDGRSHRIAPTMRVATPAGICALAVVAMASASAAVTDGASQSAAMTVSYEGDSTAPYFAMRHENDEKPPGASTMSDHPARQIGTVTATTPAVLGHLANLLLGLSSSGRHYRLAGGALRHCLRSRLRRCLKIKVQPEGVMAESRMKSRLPTVDGVSNPFAAALKAAVALSPNRVVPGDTEQIQFEIKG